MGAALRSVSEAASVPLAAASSRDAAWPPLSIAVLPFDNLSSDPENEYFSDGMTTDIIAQIELVDGVSLISHGSLPYKRTTKGVNRWPVLGVYRGERPR